MASRQPLRSQPGDFWLGAYMVAEAPVLLALSLLDSATRDNLFAAIAASPLLMVLVALGAVALGLGVGWVGYRAGFGK